MLGWAGCVLIIFTAFICICIQHIAHYNVYRIDDDDDRVYVFQLFGFKMLIAAVISVYNKSVFDWFKQNQITYTFLRHTTGDVYVQRTNFDWNYTLKNVFCNWKKSNTFEFFFFFFKIIIQTSYNVMMKNGYWWPICCHCSIESLHHDV